MNKETGQELHIWKDRAECVDLNCDQIMASLLENAVREGYEPCDLNWRGRPNIYLRGMYEGDVGTDISLFPWVKDGFIMFVRKIEK